MPPPVSALIAEHSSNRSSSHDLRNRVLADIGVPRNERHSFRQRLGNEHPIEGIAMVRRKPFHCACVFDGDCQRLKTVR